MDTFIYSTIVGLLFWILCEIVQILMILRRIRHCELLREWRRLCRELVSPDTNSSPAVIYNDLMKVLRALKKIGVKRIKHENLNEVATVALVVAIIRLDDQRDAFEETADRIHEMQKVMRRPIFKYRPISWYFKRLMDYNLKWNKAASRLAQREKAQHELNQLLRNLCGLLGITHHLEQSGTTCEDVQILIELTPA